MPVPTFIAQSLTELIALRAKKQPHAPAVHTGVPQYQELQTLSYSQLQRAVDRLAVHYSFLVNDDEALASPPPPERVVAVLTSTAIDESLLEIALAKLGLTALLLSVNNSTAAVAHLVRKTKSSHLIYGDRFQQTAEEAQRQLKDEGYEVELIAERRFPIWGDGGIDGWKGTAIPARLTPEVESKRTCVILHSSGSTGFPKPVYITHYGLIANLHSALAKPGFSALPLFHGFGHFSIFRCIYHGQPFTLHPPHIPLTSANICRVIRSSPSPPTQHFAVPYVLKLLAETEEGTETLAGFEAVSFAGAAVPDDLGDRLTKAGVNLISVYGTTETGAIFNSRRDYTKDKEWNWLRNEGPIADYIRLEPQGSRTFELIVMDGWPAKIMSNQPDGSYATKDLFLQHDSRPNLFKYIGRLDDTLTQTLGEKTNPVPIENTIRGNSPLIQECIVFGDGRPQVGCLILPSEQAADLAKDREAYIKAIWPVVSDANERSPSHSSILPDMIEILPVGTDIPVATKLSILRPACYKKFADIIDSVYERYESGSSQVKREITSQEEMEAYLHETIAGAIRSKGSDLTATTDLFAYGVDSLQAMKIRNVISKSLELGNKPLGQNVVYEHPSVRELAVFLLARKSGGERTTGSEQVQRLMLELVDKWSAAVKPATKHIGHHLNGTAGPEAQVFILTGATGSLGAHILAELVALPQVAKVFCLSRAKSHEDSVARVRSSLDQRQRVLSAEQEAKIISWAADVNKPDLGLQPEEYKQLSDLATSVIVNAWPVNFTLSLASFDPHIGGAINLLNLAQESAHRATYYFSSSVGTRQGRIDPIAEEAFPDSPSTAGGMGYGQSKWVVEKTLERAALEKNARVGVLRIGQLVGDTINGVWNETEAWPLMFKSANTIGALPALDEQLSWLPVDLAAKSITEVATRSEATYKSPAVYHIVNADASSVFQKQLLGGLRLGGLKFETVDRAEWLRRLEASEEDVEKNPTKKLLSFYKGRIGNAVERGHMDFATTETSKISPTIAGCKAVSPQLAALWVKQWTANGFLSV
ncbi:hypothetical protein NliqN6_5487 [Naganishia liquefaciens]|uniref:Carrier domain-containing protein n=1 Tax=Naganishia liquefaciens TaxID=104408 RepID=A0A8H3TYB7_9TREE|nr:hypothetical protein NliqN6_5487 [Naganishia liquefaciens]